MTSYLGMQKNKLFVLVLFCQSSMCTHTKDSSPLVRSIVELMGQSIYMTISNVFFLNPETINSFLS